MRRRPFARALSISAVVLLLISCHTEYSFEQEKVELDTLGAELWKVWHKDAIRAVENAEAKGVMLEQEYTPFVTAVDTIAPEDQLTAIDKFMSNLLTLVDDGIVPGLTRKLIIALREAAQNIELLAALATPTGPEAESFVSEDTNPNLLGYITGYPNLVPFLRFQTRIMLENDGFTDEGARTFEEDAGISDLVRVLSNELAEQTDPNEEPLAVTVRDMLLFEDSAFLSPDNPPPAFAALFDDRGYPLPAVQEDGSLPFPFTDADGDGRADIQDGKFVLTSGASVEMRPFAAAVEADINEPVTRDSFGRALGANGDPVFEYVDLHKTGLGFMLRQQYRMSTEDTLYDMLGAFKTIMGQKQVYTDEIGGYDGYAQEQPLMDMSHALIHTIDTPGLPDFLEGVSEMSRRHPQALARLFWSIDNMIDILNADPKYEMRDNQTIVYDLLPYLHEISSDPALWADVMAALRDPISAKQGAAYATMLKHRDSNTVPVKDGPYDSCFQRCKGQFEIGTTSRFDCIRSCPQGELFSDPMDFNAVESPQTISIFQKMQHLLRDASDKPYVMAIENASLDGDPLVEVPPLLAMEEQGVAFMRALAGNLDLADSVPADLWDTDFGELLVLFGVGPGDVAGVVATISDLFGAHLDRNPTPDQITRLFNQPDIKFETMGGEHDIILDPADPECHDGYVLSQHLAYVLYSAEGSGAIDTLYPLAKAFSDHGREDILLNIMIVLHDHYAGNGEVYRTAAGGPSPMKAANLRSYEPAMVEIFEKGELFEALYDFSAAQHEVELTSGIPVTEALRQIVEKGTNPSNYTNRRGENFVNINDGRTVNNASALHHLLAAMDEASARLDEDPEAKEKLDDAVGAMAKIMVGTKRELGAPPQFEDPGSVVFTAHITQYLANKAREKQAQGQLSPWLQQDVLADIEQLWRSRTLAALIDLADEALTDPADKEIVDGFMAYLLGSPAGQAQTLVAVHQMLVRSIADDRWLPIARYLSSVIDPDREWETTPYGPVSMVTLGALLLKKTLDADPDNTGIFLIHRGLKRPLYGDAPFTTVVDVIARYLSPNPLNETFETANDYQHFLIEMADYMADDVHGAERLYELVDRRIKPDAATTESGEEPASE